MDTVVPHPDQIPSIWPFPGQHDDATGQHLYFFPIDTRLLEEVYDPATKQTLYANDRLIVFPEIKMKPQWQGLGKLIIGKMTLLQQEPAPSISDESPDVSSLWR